MNRIWRQAICAALGLMGGAAVWAAAPALSDDTLRRAVAYFNGMEPEGVVNAIPNAQAADWMAANVPRFDCPATDFRQIYYFRWWAFRKHFERQTDGHYLMSEFINRPKPISSALGHHLYEGRWMKDPAYINDDVLYWLRGDHGAAQPDLHRFSSWLQDAVYARYLATGDAAFATGLLDDLVRDYQLWVTERQLPNGLFWQFDVRDAMEESISGSRKLKNVRPTINGYMYGNARAIAAIARMAGKADLAAEYTTKAEELRRKVQAELWNPKDNFFEVREEGDGFAPAREELGYIPWYFELPLPSSGDQVAWAQFADPTGFSAPWGLTTAERRNPAFRTHGVGKCEWDGSVWPFATSQTLTALGNVLRDYPPAPVTRQDYFAALLTYARSHQYDGKPYLGEYLDEKTGHWLKGLNVRSWYYNHSTFADLVITGLAGLRPRADATIDIVPLLPDGAWDWFCLDDVPYHGHRLTLVWDKTGKHYGWGEGFALWVDGCEVARSKTLGRLKGNLAP